MRDMCSLVFEMPNVSNNFIRSDFPKAGSDEYAPKHPYLPFEVGNLLENRNFARASCQLGSKSAEYAIGQ
jgi:hypothetical protein